MHPFRSLAHQRQDNDYNKSNRNRTPSNTQTASKYPRKKDFTASYYAYGKSAAIEFCCDETKKQKIHTITLHAANARTDADRGYDWENKSIIQLPRHEMLVVTAVLMGLVPLCEFRQTGAHSAKSYKVEHQGTKVFFMIMERGKPVRAVGLSPEDTYHTLSLFVRQLKENSPWMTVSEIVQMIEMSVVRMNSATFQSSMSEEELEEAETAYEGYAEQNQADDWEEEAESDSEPNYNI